MERVGGYIMKMKGQVLMVINIKWRVVVGVYKVYGSVHFTCTLNFQPTTSGWMAG